MLWLAAFAVARGRALVFDLVLRRFDGEAFFERDAVVFFAAAVIRPRPLPRLLVAAFAFARGRAVVPDLVARPLDVERAFERDVVARFAAAVLRPPSAVALRLRGF